MELNAKKCKETIIDFRKNKTIIRETRIGNQPIPREVIQTAGYLVRWYDGRRIRITLPKSSETAIFVKEIEKLWRFQRGFKILLYCATMRSVVEYGAQLLHGNLTNEQHGAIERIEKRALRIIYPGLEYDEALDESKLKSLKQRRNDLCVDLIEKMMQLSHTLHGLLPEQNPNTKSKTTRSSGKEIYNFYCRTDVLGGSTIVFAIDKYNKSIS